MERFRPSIRGGTRTLLSASSTRSCQLQPLFSGFFFSSACFSTLPVSAFFAPQAVVQPDVVSVAPATRPAMVKPAKTVFRSFFSMRSSLLRFYDNTGHVPVRNRYRELHGEIIHGTTIFRSNIYMTQPLVSLRCRYLPETVPLHTV